MSILRPVIRSVLQPLLRSPLEPGVGSLTAEIRAMFGSAKGVMYDLSLKSSLYQDSARTTLVSASGDPIGSVTDLSPNLKHASQATADSRPAWNSGGYGTLDGTADHWATEAIDFTGTDAVTVVASVRKTSDAASAAVVELSASVSSNNGTFLLRAPRVMSAVNAAYSRGTSLSEATGSGSFAAPVTMVMTGDFDISSDRNVLRINGAEVGTSATDQGTGNFGNYAMYIGARAGTQHFFTGRIYRMLVIGRALTAAELAKAERWAGQPAGIAL